MAWACVPSVQFSCMFQSVCKFGLWRKLLALNLQFSAQKIAQRYNPSEPQPVLPKKKKKRKNNVSKLSNANERNTTLQVAAGGLQRLED